MASGRQLAEHNVSIFTAWIASKSDSDFRRIVHRGALSRSVMARECGFAKSVLTQNPRIKALLSDLETELRITGVLPESSGATALGESQPSLNAALALPFSHNAAKNSSATSELETKLQRLQLENACQHAEIEELRRQLKQFTSIHEALSNSGRLPR